jgi:hypothetical protein
MVRIYAEVEGLPRLLQKLTPQWLYWEILKKQLDEAGAHSAAEAAHAADGFARTYTLATGIQHKVNAIPKPLWAVVTTNATSRTGRRYPFILEFSGKYGHKNWLRDAVRRAQQGMETYTQMAAGEIESKWGS